MKKFNDLITNENLIKGIEEMGYLEPTKIQAKAIPLVIEGTDIIAKSNTGTGKTAAFGLPILEKLTNDEINKALVICPTRELAMQVSDEINRYAKYLSYLKIVTVYGGSPINRQIQQLNKGFNILVGTPGRIQDLVKRKVVNLKNVEAVVLDEADEMLNMGFREDIENILSMIKNHQTVLFSATMPKEIRQLAEKFLNNQVEIEVRSKHKTVDKIDQYYYYLDGGNKDDATKILLHYYKSDLTIIFCNTKRKVDELVEKLNKMGINSAALHGDIAQERRTRIMKTFKHAEKMVLVASDVAARGIDVDNIDLVINYDFPQENELYIHRIGRTGRAGKQGVAITLCKTKKDLRLVKQLMKYTKSNIDERQMPSNEELVKVHNELFIKKVVEESKKGLNDENLNIANDLLKEGLQAQDIVCALISLANPKPILVTSKKKKKSNSRDRDRDHGRDRGRDNKQASRSNKSNNSNSNKYEVITINAGRNDGINVHKAINILKKNGKLKDHAIGNIDIQRLKTTVEVTSKEAKQAMQKMSNVSYNGKNLTISMKHERKSRKRK